MKNDADKWLLAAEGDFDLAKKGKVSKKVTYHLLCYHIQQAVEKAMKAILIHFDSPYPKTHNIEVLLNAIKELEISIPKNIFLAKQFTGYAGRRYPDDYYPIDKKEYQDSLKVAVKVLQWAKSLIEKKAEKLF